MDFHYDRPDDKTFLDQLQFIIIVSYDTIPVQHFITDSSFLFFFTSFFNNNLNIISLGAILNFIDDYCTVFALGRITVVDSISNVFDNYGFPGKRLFVLLLLAKQNIVCTYVHAADQPVEIYVQSVDKSNLPGKSERAFVEIINIKPFD